MDIDIDIYNDDDEDNVMSYNDDDGSGWSSIKKLG